MKLVRPKSIDDAVLTSSTVAEDDAPAWNASVSYAIDAIVIRGHRRWRSLTAGNVGTDPLSPGQNKWTDLGATNRWAMFDEAVGSRTTAAGSLAVAIAPGRIDTIAVLDIACESVTVVMTVGGTKVYERTQATAIGGTAIDNWYSWFFEPIGRRTTLIFDDLPPYPTGTITVTLKGENAGSVVTCGTLIAGRMFEVGSTEAGAEAGILDFSRKTTDDFGVTTVVQRGFAGRTTMRALAMTARVTAIRDTLADLRATPTLWIGEDGIDVLTLFGFYKSFSITLTLPNISYVSVEIEGLT